MDGCADGLKYPKTSGLIKKEWLVATSDKHLRATIGRTCSNQRGSPARAYPQARGDPGQVCRVHRSLPDSDAQEVGQVY
eukprot:5753113-Pyramimonas_sp.AAC.1